MDRHETAAFAERNGLRVVEDAAHSLPTRSDGALIGSATALAGPGAAAVFSFYATKTMTTGEGGMIVLLSLIHI